MSALALIAANTPAFQYPDRYCYHAGTQDEADIIALDSVRAPQKVTLRGALQILGQFCADEKNRGILFGREIHRAFKEAGIASASTRKRWRRQLVASGALRELDDGYQLRTYARHNRTPEEWADIALRRKQYQAEWQRKKRAEQRAFKAQVMTQSDYCWPPPPEESPDTCTISHISGGDDSHLTGERSEPTQPLPLPDLSGPIAFPNPPTSARRSGGDLRSTSPTSSQPRYTGRPAEEIGGGETETRDSAPVKPRRILPWKPRPRVVKAKSKAMGPDESGLCEVKTLIQDICAKMAARGAADGTGESPTGVGVR